MASQKLQFYFLLILLAAILIIAWQIFSPFFNSLVLAIVFATVFHPVHKKVLKLSYNRKVLASIVTSIAIVLVVLVPISFIGTQIFKESKDLYTSITTNGGVDTISKTVQNLNLLLKNKIPGFPGFVPEMINLDKYAEGLLRSLVQHLDTIFSSFAKIVTGVFLFLIALYYILKDSEKLKKSIVMLSPLPDKDDEMIFNKLSMAINSVIKGSLTVALLQGTISAIGFLLFGVPNAIFWGTVTVVSALIPGIGTALVLIPAILFLIFTGNVIPAIGLTIWGGVAVGLIDNFLGPKLVGKGMELHPLIVFISVLGGILFFGPLGFLLGPLTMSLLFALIDIYSNATRES